MGNGILLPSRLYPLRPHEMQLAYDNSPHRFNVVPAGRRSGKTERAKRKLVKRAMSAVTPWQPKFFVGAPTRDQAKRIYWDDLKAMIPKHMRGEEPSESSLVITTLLGAQIWVMGMDKPERVEGSPWDGGILDEYGNMKERVWSKHVRPAMSDRKGWCDFIGVPEGRNHYYDLAVKAKARMDALGAASEWGYFHWESKDILDPAEIAAAKEDLDELSFDQEYGGKFVNFSGLAYYNFNREVNAIAGLRNRYNKKGEIGLCFDFNVDPGVCVIVQEMDVPAGSKDIATCVIGEVHIPRNSNTPAVCRKIVQDWKGHEGLVACYGDATGGARGTAKVAGSDWDIIKAELSPHFKRMVFRVKPSNPAERARVNAVNSRTRSASGKVRLYVDSMYAENVVKDFEAVVLLDGGSGEIDKAETPKHTHLTDALGYYVDYVYPVSTAAVRKVQIGGF